MTDTLLALSTENCRIAPLTADDARALAAITDETVTSQIHFLPTPFTESDARALIAGSGGGDVFHAVRDVRGADLNGVIGVHRRVGQDYEVRSEEHTSELQSLMRISYAVFCLQQKT